MCKVDSQFTVHSYIIEGQSLNKNTQRLGQQMFNLRNNGSNMDKIYDSDWKSTSLWIGNWHLSWQLIKKYGVRILTTITWGNITY